MGPHSWLKISWIFLWITAQKKIQMDIQTKSISLNKAFPRPCVAETNSYYVFEQ